MRNQNFDEPERFCQWNTNYTISYNSQMGNFSLDFFPKRELETLNRTNGWQLLTKLEKKGAYYCFSEDHTLLDLQYVLSFSVGTPDIIFGFPGL